MRGVRDKEKRLECIRLRTRDRLSIKEIERASGVARSTLSKWLRGHPLTRKERKAKINAGRLASSVKRRKDRGDRSAHHRMAAERELTRHEKGKIAEAAVLFRLCLHGFSVYGSPFDGDRLDWVVEAPSRGKIHRVQVRWAKDDGNGLPSVSLQHNVGRSNQERYRDSDLDAVVGYDLYTDSAYVWMIDELSERRYSVTITPDALERWDKLC